MRVMVTGGAGYIGSHAVQILIGQGHTVVVVDDLRRGHAAAIERLRGSLDPDASGRLIFAEADVGERRKITALLEEHGVEAVMHFAALAYVGESVSDPLLYHANNTGAAIDLLRACDRAGVSKFVVSSTCATYGEPETVPIAESTPQKPINPYGWSKLHVERVLRDHAAACRDKNRAFSYAALRYFNVAGADPTGVLGEWHQPETHLIPIVLEVALGKRERITVFGEDYPTPDGTCIRDYVHVTDLVEAHATVLEHLRPGEERFYNLGIGRGYSVREVIESARRVTGHAIPEIVGTRRAGDPPSLYADPSRIQDELGWSARFTDLDEIIATAWRWFRDNPSGYDR